MEGELATIEEARENFCINRFEKKHSGKGGDGRGEGERVKKKGRRAPIGWIGGGGGGGKGWGWDKKRSGRTCFVRFVCCWYFFLGRRFSLCLKLIGGGTCDTPR